MRSKNINDILSSITPEEQSKIDAMLLAQVKWMEEHPDYHKRYGTDKSYWLEDILAKGFNPVGITVTICEETIIMETQEEIEKAWEIFSPEGWWYTVDQWKERRVEYVNKFYKGVESDAPPVYWLNDKFKDL
jgi:hypothetical protein